MVGCPDGLEHSKGIARHNGDLAALLAASGNSHKHVRRAGNDRVSIEALGGYVVDVSLADCPVEGDTAHHR